MNQVTIPDRLIEHCGSHEEGAAWLKKVPHMVGDLSERWGLTLAEPFNAEASCSWVAPCTLADGTSAVFKLGWLHMEAEDEIQGMQFWNGDPTAYLLDSDASYNALLLERCEPGTILRAQPEPIQDEVLAQLLKRLWRSPSAPFSFRPLSEMIQYHIEEVRNRVDVWLDPTITQIGLDVFPSLLSNTTDHVLLATDLHAGNVLQSKREPWLVIDPKPFVGDPAYDATQHLLNCWERLKAEPKDTIERFAHLLDVDAERVRLWAFARIATMEADNTGEKLALAQALAP